ncbi:hypothetical protein ACFWNC_26715 [Streptomyces sp. NPDC058369]|uniref:hypothetical protein n=1 Tax=unclassified Streptomyces TaxID=2593676 RepID=UPI0022544BDE|nr:hypothetical protein [Streptomyces sp. NBC_01789]MCX4444894.1 hypothetical protein [Streptomyces sp. NBC_01789]
MDGSRRAGGPLGDPPSRDAVELTRAEQDLGPLTERTYPTRREPAARVQVAGRERRAAALRRRDYPDGRTAFLLGLLPAQKAPVAAGGRVWVWADEYAMWFTALHEHPAEAQPVSGDARPVRYGPEGFSATPPALTRCTGPKARLLIRVGGRWNPAHALVRARFREGHALAVRIVLTENGWPMTYPRTYWWDPAAIRTAHDR